MALGTSAGALVNAGLLATVFERRVGGLGRQGLAGALVRMALAALVMAGSVWLTCVGLERCLGTRGLWAQLATGLGPVLLGGIVYLAVARWWRIPEAGAVLAVLSRYAGRRRLQAGGP